MPLFCVCTQVDLKRRKTITGIITQGVKIGLLHYHVQSFKVSHSDDGRSWTVIKDAHGSDKVRAVVYWSLPQCIIGSLFIYCSLLVMAVVYSCGLLLSLVEVRKGGEYFVQSTLFSWLLENCNFPLLVANLRYFNW